MKLNVQGIEEIEITDPSGLCNLAALPPLSLPQPGISIQQQPRPMPAIPGGLGDPTIRPIPGGFGRRPPIDPAHYTRHIDDPTKWGVGGEAIRRAGQQVDPEKWEKNWQSKGAGGDPDDGNRSTH